MGYIASTMVFNVSLATISETKLQYYLQIKHQGPFKYLRETLAKESESLVVYIRKTRHAYSNTSVSFPKITIHS